MAEAAADLDVLVAALNDRAWRVRRTAALALAAFPEHRASAGARPSRLGRAGPAGDHRPGVAGCIEVLCPT
jgi:hypothetical protein